ncbi:MAG: sensor histidine kinase [Lachnospiraceae bacterium]|nr:sensor histidine kinase [Lachnospiraceae bacterium]
MKKIRAVKEKLHNNYVRYMENMKLDAKIRFSLLIVVLPLIIFMLMWMLWFLRAGNRYSQVIQNATKASEFSLDFKVKFDSDMYQVVCGGKDFKEARPYEEIRLADDLMATLENTTDIKKNKSRAKAIRKYLKNLKRYVGMIEDNLGSGNHYKENFQIWENDIQTATDIIQDTILELLYYENKDMENVRAEIGTLTAHTILISFVIWILLVAYIFYFTLHIPKVISDPIRDLCYLTDQVAGGNLQVRAQLEGSIEVKELGSSLNEMISEIQELLDTVREEQTQLREAELELLQMQINPHFLYNTLDTIIWLAEAGEKKEVVHMVGALSDFFRVSLNEGNDMITIREEMRHAKDYLEIQGVRYRDIMDFQMEVAPEIEDCLIPKITIQPIIENALYHGIKNKRGKGTIRIEGTTRGHLIIIKIADNGKGMTKERLTYVRETLSQKRRKGEHHDVYGLHNIKERIQLVFGEEYGLKINSEYMEGTSVELIIPKRIKSE